MADYARSVNILVEIAGNPEAKLDAINKKLDEMPKKTVVSSGAPDTVNKLTATTDRATGAFSNLGSKMSSAFGTVKSSLTDLQGSIQNMASSLAGITVGGAVSGLAWLDKAKSNLYVEQMANAVNANKKLGISFDQLKEKAKGEAAAGEDTTTGAMKELFAISTMGQKYVGKGDKALNNADAIGDFYTKHQEMLQEQGIMDAEQMVQRAIMTQGKMGGRFGTKFAMALGVSLDDPSMKTAKSRMKLFMEEGAKVDIKAELDKRPWDQAEVAIRSLKSSIGDSIATPMAFVTTLFADFVKLIAKIPGGSALIGYAGMFLALASAASLVIGVMTPLWTFMKAVNAAMGISTILKAADASATVADAGAHAMLTGAMEGEFVATELTTAAQNMSFAARIRLIGATLWDTAARYANSAANLLGIGSLLGLAGAEGVAAGGAWALAAGVWAALAPLLPFIAAGAALVAVFALILEKAGVLQPLLESFGDTFEKLKAGDLSGAWNELSDGFSKLLSSDSLKKILNAVIDTLPVVMMIKGASKLLSGELKIPSFSEALKNFFTGTQFFSVVTRLLGVPLYKIIDFLSSILDVVKKIKDFVDWIIGLFYKYIWTPLKGIWDSVTSIIEKVLGKSLSGDELKTAWIDALKSSSNTGLANANSEKTDALWDVVANGKTLSRDERLNLGITPLEIEEAKRFYDNLKSSGNPTGQSAISSKIDETLDENVNKPIADFMGNTAYGLQPGTYRKNADGTYDAVINMAGGATPLTGISLEDVKKYNLVEASNVQKNALGGEVTKSGLAIVDEGEPIVPAEINRSSNLINLLETLASGNISNSKSNQTVINFEYTATGTGTGNGVYLDQFAFERKVKEIIGKCTRTYGSY